MDKRITQLVEATALEKDDLLNIVDISDTTMSANGSTKKIEYANIMKAPPITNWDGWQETGHTWTKDADHKFIVTGDFTSFYQKGHKVRFMDTTLKYGVIGKVELISGDTVITLINTSDYAIVGLSITTNAISNIENPTGFPGRFSYIPSYGASGSMTYTSTTTHYAYWSPRSTGFLLVSVSVNGTTGGGASNTITVTLPVATADLGENQTIPCNIRDGGGTFGGSIHAINDTTQMSARRFDASNFGLGATRFVQLTGEFCYA